MTQDELRQDLKARRKEQKRKLLACVNEIINDAVDMQEFTPIWDRGLDAVADEATALHRATQVLISAGMDDELDGSTEQDETITRSETAVINAAVKFAMKCHERNIARHAEKQARREIVERCVSNWNECATAHNARIAKRHKALGRGFAEIQGTTQRWTEGEGEDD